MTLRASSLVFPWFTPHITFTLYTLAPCPPARPPLFPTPSTRMVSCSLMNRCLMPVTGCLLGVPVTSVLQHQRSCWPTCVPTQPCLVWWTLSCCLPIRHRFHRQLPAISTCPHPAARVPCPVPSPSVAPLAWVWHATTPTANPTCKEPQDFPCHPCPPPQPTTPPMPSTVRDWAQPQPLDTSDIQNCVDAHRLQAPAWDSPEQPWRWILKIGVITSTGHHACWPACQEHHLLASGLRLVLQRQKTDGSTAAAEKEQTLVIQDGWEAELKNDKLVLIFFVFLNISLLDLKKSVFIFHSSAWYSTLGGKSFAVQMNSNWKGMI